MAVQESGSRRRIYVVTFSGNPGANIIVFHEANLLYLSTGSVMSWPSPTLPKLTGKITPEEGSWIGALCGLGAAVGPSMVAASLDTLGRKATLLINGFVFLTSWIILLSSQNLAAIYVARVIGGLGVGASFCAASVYTAEIADDTVRGAMGSLNQVFSGLGMMVQYCAGPYVSYTVLLIISACITLLFGVVFVFMPESPYHLVNKGQRQKAADVIRWVRDNPSPHLVDKEIAEIERNLAEQNQTVGVNRTDIVLKRGPVKALMLCLYLMLCEELCGIDIVVNYTEPIFDLAKMSISSELSPIIVCTVNVVAAFFAPPIVKKFGLRNVLITSGVAMGFCLLALGIYFALLAKGQDLSAVSVLPVIILMVFNVFFGIGMGPLPWAVVAEMFPSHLKGVANCLVGCFAWLLAFGLVKGYEDVRAAVGPEAVFLALGTAAVLASGGLWRLFPDTRKMSMNDIQDWLWGNMKIEDDQVSLESF